MNSIGSQNHHMRQKKLIFLQEPTTSRGLYKYGGRDLPVPTGTYKEDGELEYRSIASGDVSSLTTDDPDKLPLPSWPLLEMQWHLRRIAGMSGAAEANEDLDHNIDDDNDAKEIDNHTLS